MTRRTSPSRRQFLRPLGPARRAHPAADLAKTFAAMPPVADDAMRTLVAENLALVRELARIQQRSTRWRDECRAEADRLDARLMRARAACIAKDTRIAALQESLDVLRKRSATWLTNEELVRRSSDLRARNRSLEHELAELRRQVAALSVARANAATSAANEERVPVAAPARIPEVGERPVRRVLCVGGRSRHVPLYRELVERRGGQFSHAEGGVDDAPADLEALLAGADLVILQAGYVCNVACLAVEAHCARTGKRCVLLPKPCAQAFAACLVLALPDDVDPSRP